MGNPSTIWTQLAAPNPASGMVPFVFTDGMTVVGDVGNLYYNQTTHQLSVSTNYDYSGIDAINTYYQQDSYLPQSMQITSANGGWFNSASLAGHTVSASRGTGIVPLVNQVGDPIGGFSGWGYQGTIPSYTALAGMYVFAAASGTAGNLGGELHFATRSDAGNISDRVVLDNSGNLYPATNGAANLGKVGYGWGKLNLNYTIAVATGNQVQSTPAGKVLIAAAGTTVTVTNSLVDINSIVIATLQTNDATATIKNVVTAAGGFTINLGAAATAQVTIGYLIINTDN